MIVVHIESGLGNQMLGYLEYLAIKQANPKEECFIETIVYELGDKQNVIKMWNGYELESIFGIKAPNINGKFSPGTWEKIVDDVKKSEFWDNNWAYPEAITKAFKNQGLILKNTCVSHGSPIKPDEGNLKGKIKKAFRNIADGKVFAYYDHYRDGYRFKKQYEGIDHSNDLYPSNLHNTFSGFTLKFCNVGYGIEKLDTPATEIFIFSEFTSEKNIRTAKDIQSCNSVAIHARRGDLLTFNGVFYKNGYFKRATKLIKKTISNPVFYFFSDPGSVDWCMDNLDIFGLDKAKDDVRFVYWNKGIDSYRDMQLMSLCKAAIVTNSSFGWWGAYFIDSPDKVTISPRKSLLTTDHC